MATFMDEFQHLKIQLEEIKSATDNFADNNQIGRGGFGKVYKGVISHSKGRSMAAIKRLDGRYGQGNTEFWREIMMLSHYTHENLVSLLGFCDENREKILVYEYASHGSLDHHLSVGALTWMQRLRICLAATRGLRYLHDPKGTQQRVLHRDIKSSNILLDENWNAKVSDFGLSRIGPANQQHTALISNVVGTLGYLDPLYMEIGLLTKESDVYSLGVVLFEVLCGRLCFEYNNGRVVVLARIWKQSYKKKKLHEIIHQDLLQQMDPNSLETFSDIAYQCLRTSREKRPTMALVMEKIEIALKFQEVYEEAEQRMKYKEMIQTGVPPLLNRSTPELDMLRSNRILVYTTEEDDVEVEPTFDDTINKLKLLRQEFTKYQPASHVPNPLTMDFFKIMSKYIGQVEKALINNTNILDGPPITSEAIKWAKKKKRIAKTFGTINWDSLDESEWASLLNGESTRFGGLSQQQKCRCSSMKPQQKSSTWGKGSVKVNRCHPSTLFLRRRG